MMTPAMTVMTLNVAGKEGGFDGGGGGGGGGVGKALWARSTKNPDVITGPLARPFAHTAHSFICSAPLASLARSAALTRSLTLLTPSLVGK